MNKTLWALAASAVALGASAKLPPPDDAAKVKAAEAAAKAAWQSKVDAFHLCKEQDKVAAKYGKHEAKATPAAAKPAASAAASAASGTPVTASAPPPCTDPGPFAYNPPDQKPLETSGAHSPSGTATNPPSNKPEAAKMAPTKK